jgi:hypothetical protein
MASVPALAVIAEVTGPARFSVEGLGRLWVFSHSAVQLLVIGSARPERSHLEPSAADWLDGIGGGRLEPAPGTMLADASSSGDATAAGAISGLSAWLGGSSGASPASTSGPVVI